MCGPEERHAAGNATEALLFEDQTKAGFIATDSRGSNGDQKDATGQEHEKILLLTHGHKLLIIFLSD